MALTKVTGNGVEGITNLSNATFLSVDASEVATLLTSAVINSEGGAATTNIAHGLAKAWCSYDGSGTVAIDDSFNISGITDENTGSYTLTINSDMSNTTYSPQSCGDQTGGATNTCITNVNNSATAIFIVVRQDGSTIDNDDMYLTVHGDLA